MHLSEIWRKHLLHCKTMKIIWFSRLCFWISCIYLKIWRKHLLNCKTMKIIWFSRLDLNIMHLSEIWRKHLLNCKTMKIIWFTRLWIWISCIYLKFEGNTSCTVRRWKSFDSRDSGCKVNNVHTINRLFRPILQILNFVVLSDGYAKDFNQSLQQNWFI